MADYHCQFCKSPKVNREVLDRGYVDYDCSDCGGEWKTHFDLDLEFEVVVDSRHPDKIKREGGKPKPKRIPPGDLLPKPQTIQQQMFEEPHRSPEEDLEYCKPRLAWLAENGRVGKFHKDPVERLAGLESWTPRHREYAKKLAHRYRKQLREKGGFQ